LTKRGYLLIIWINKKESLMLDEVELKAAKERIEELRGFL
jgi:hypothetical protein